MSCAPKHRFRLAALLALIVALAACMDGNALTTKACSPPLKLDRSSDIRGPDTNNNGIRDDIDAWIAAQPISDVQKKAAQQMARAHQAMILLDLNDQTALQALGDLSMAGVKCLRRAFMPDYQAGYDLGSQLEAMTANTKNRAKQYIAYNRAVSGSSGTLPQGNTCEP